VAGTPHYISKEHTVAHSDEVNEIYAKDLKSSPELEMGVRLCAMPNSNYSQDLGLKVTIFDQQIATFQLMQYPINHSH
jgi:hypothetical protein